MLLPLYTLSLCLLLFKFVSFKVSDVNLESDINLIEKSIAAYARVHGHLPRPIQGLVPYRAIGLSKNFFNEPIKYQPNADLTNEMIPFDNPCFFLDNFLNIDKIENKPKNLCSNPNQIAYTLFIRQTIKQVRAYQVAEASGFSCKNHKIKSSQFKGDKYIIYPNFQKITPAYFL